MVFRIKSRFRALIDTVIATIILGLIIFCIAKWTIVSLLVIAILALMIRIWLWCYKVEADNDKRTKSGEEKNA